jgi:hypothetical protein
MFLYAASSAMIHGVGRDAAYVALARQAIPKLAALHLTSGTDC